MNYEEAYEYGKHIIFTQQYPNKLAEYNEVCLKALKIQIPQKVKIEAWSPSCCPNCNEYLSEHIDDGYYKHYEHLNICPYCGQKIYW